MSRAHPTEEEKHLDRIHAWARSLPEAAWTPGLPDTWHTAGFIAVKMETGKILTGRAYAFRPYMVEQIAKDPRYGRCISHVIAGD